MAEGEQGHPIDEPTLKTWSNDMHPTRVTLQSQALHDIFGPNGLLARGLPGWESRPGQGQLAEAIQTAIINESSLVAEGPTGIGKSLAYLIAILNTGQQALVCTATKVLQDQLAHKDLPMLQSIWPKPFSWAVLKGRENYVCRHDYNRLQDQADGDEAPLFESDIDVEMWPQLQAWIAAEDAQDGVADLDTIPLALSGQLRAEITVDAQRCLGKQCPSFDSCFVERAKHRAEDATIVIANHHLLLLDGLTRAHTEDAIGLLPARDIVILDEAHNLEDVATAVLGTRLTAARWRWIESHFQQLTMGQIPAHPDALFALTDNPLDDDVEHHLDDVLNHATQVIVDGVAQVTNRFRQWLHAMREATWEPMPADVGELSDLTRPMVTAMRQVLHLAVRAGWSVDTLAELRRLIGVCETLAADAALAAGPDDGRYARYLAKEGGRFPYATVNVSVISVAEPLERLLWARYQTVIALSATLRTGGSFDYWLTRVGCLTDANTLACPSPFDYRQQARLFLPQPPRAYVPYQPSQEQYPAYEARMIETIGGLLKASEGRALVLCTSLRAMRTWADALRDTLSWRVLVQGDGPRAHLLQDFAADVHSILFATKSFWQGVDIPGESLSLLIIDKLPFATPDDPIVAARAAAIDRAHGAGASFGRLSLPTAALALQQGMGRLIRRATDKGVMALLDGRVLTKNYGAYLLRSLPSMPRIHTLVAVEAFLVPEGDR